MLIDLIERYGSIVQSWTVTHFDREGDDFRLKAQVLFVDGSQLHIRQVVIDGCLLKYAYQWQTIVESGEYGALWLSRRGGARAPAELLEAIAAESTAKVAGDR